MPNMMERSRNSCRRYTAMAIVLAVAGVGCGGSGTAGLVRVSNDAETPISEPPEGSGSGWSPSWTPTSQGAGSESANAAVTRVVDGDTVEVRFRGRTIDVRLIGIDTPETVDPTQPVGCYGKAASNFTTARLSGERVRLEFDVERTDRYGRTLAYVWIGGPAVQRGARAAGVRIGLDLPAERDVRRSVPGRAACRSRAGARALGRLSGGKRRWTEMRPVLSRRVHPSPATGPRLRRHRVPHIPREGLGPAQLRW